MHVRRFWRGDQGVAGEMASRLAGSSESPVEASLRAPQASISFVACHDGFTLQDLVELRGRNINEANGEENRGGNDHNLSRNLGRRGPTDAPHVLRMRERIKRNLLATVAFFPGAYRCSRTETRN